MILVFIHISLLSTSIYESPPIPLLVIIFMCFCFDFRNLKQINTFIICLLELFQLINSLLTNHDELFLFNSFTYSLMCYTIINLENSEYCIISLSTSMLWVRIQQLRLNCMFSFINR